MNGSRAASRALVVIPVVMMVVAVVGFILTMALNVFVLDRYNAYGEVPIPGTGSLHLPAGEVTVSLHTQVVSSPTGSGLPVPELSMTVVPPAEVADPTFNESIGSTTTVNNDAHRRLWRMQIAVEGDYQITTHGQIGGFISPRLAFGSTNSHGSLVWVFVVLFLLGVLGQIWRWLLARPRRRRASAPGIAEPVAAFTPSGEGVRLEQLKTLAALRDSGALTQQEFEAEKRRIISGR